MTGWWMVLRARDSERLNLATLSSLTVEGTMAKNSAQCCRNAGLGCGRSGLSGVVSACRLSPCKLTLRRDSEPRSSPPPRPAVDKLRARLPAGYSIEEGGAVAESDKGNRSVFTVLPVTLVIMLLLLMLQLRRYSRMFLALFMALFGFTGHRSGDAAG